MSQHYRALTFPIHKLVICRDSHISTAHNAESRLSIDHFQHPHFANNVHCYPQSTVIHFHYSEMQSQYVPQLVAKTSLLFPTEHVAHCKWCSLSIENLIPLNYCWDCLVTTSTIPHFSSICCNTSGAFKTRWVNSSLLLYQSNHAMHSFCLQVPASVGHRLSASISIPGNCEQKTAFNIIHLSPVCVKCYFLYFDESQHWTISLFLLIAQLYFTMSSFKTFIWFLYREHLKLDLLLGNNIQHYSFVGCLCKALFPTF